MTHSSSKDSTSHSQDVAVVIQIEGGNFIDGFPVSLQILENGATIDRFGLDEHLCIPAAPDMQEKYSDWQSQSNEGSRRLQHRLLSPQARSSDSHSQSTSRLAPIDDGQTTNVSDSEKFAAWREMTDSLQDYCQQWFRKPEFDRLCDRVLRTVAIKNDLSVPIVLCCEKHNPDWHILQRLPFHLWNLHDKLPNSEFVLSAGYRRPISPLKRPVRILAILGSSKGGLRLQEDSEALNLLKRNSAKIIRESEPTNDKLSSLLSEKNTWDILFFSGHSSSVGKSGKVTIRGDETLALENLRPYLVKAKTKGLKLCVFNSCDGLKIAEFLTNLGIPNIIAMKEPVPDDIACLFLIEFLKGFTEGTQLCKAVRQARDRLALEQDKVPAASWLPIVCLNPSASELVMPKQNRLKRSQLILGSALLSGLLAAAIPIALYGPCKAVPAAFQDFVTVLDCPVPIETYISVGDHSVEGSKVVLSDYYFSLKEEALEAFDAGNHDKAVLLFDGLRSHARVNKDTSDGREAALAALQDPEVLIYRNNAFVKALHSKDPTLPLYTIAVAAPLNTDPGISIALGVAQAQDIAVQQGINLQVVIANDGNKREQARRVADYLSKDKQVLAVVGHYTSPNTCAALNIYSPNNLVVVSPASTMVNLPSNLDCGGDPNHIFLRTVSNTRIEAETLIEYLIEERRVTQPKIVVFYNANELFSRDMYEQFRQVLNSYGGDLIAAFDLSDPKLKADSFPPQVRQADAIAILPDGGTDNRIALEKGIALAKLNNGKLPILGANTLYTQGVIDEGGDTLVDSLFIAVDWHPKMCGAERFAQQVREYWGGDSNRITALSYEAVQVLASILPSTSDIPIDRQDVSLKLYDTGIREGAAPSSDVFSGQTISFGPNGDRIEITTREIVTVNDQLMFALVDDDNCPIPESD